MSKTRSGLFTSTTGANSHIDNSPSSKNLTVPQSPIRDINPNEIRYSQTSVNGSTEIIEDMKINGWHGDPIDVVIMNDGKLTTLDNTRVVAAKVAGIEVKANVHNYSDPLPNEALMERFSTRKGGTPKTWGQAVENRIGKQSSAFRKNNPNGSYNMNQIK